MRPRKCLLNKQIIPWLDISVNQEVARCSNKDCYEKMIDSLIDIDVKYTFRFMQCTGRGALTDDQTGALMVHMLLIKRSGDVYSCHSSPYHSRADSTLMGNAMNG